MNKRIPKFVVFNINQLTRKRNFLKFVTRTVNTYRPYDPALYLYNMLFNLRENHTLEELFKKEDFFFLLYATLKSWNMDQRGAKLVDFKKFKRGIKKLKSKIFELEKDSMLNLKKSNFNSVLEKVNYVFKNLIIMATKTQIVGISKTLHFLLPNLVMPIDRKYTMNFCFGNNRYESNIKKEMVDFDFIFIAFYWISKQLKLKPQDLRNSSLQNWHMWNKSIPKMIDNAIIGFMTSGKRRGKKKVSLSEIINSTFDYNTKMF